LQETDIPPYPFAKIGLDLSGPYPTSLSGNRYIVSFIDLYSGWPEAFPVADKSAENIVHLLQEEIIPRFGCPIQIVSDNGTENVNRKVKETLEEMNIHHIKTSYYSPQANGKVERFHGTFHDVMAKKIQEDVSTWDLYLNQTLMAVRCHADESTKLSPYFFGVQQGCCVATRYYFETQEAIYGKRPTPNCLAATAPVIYVGASTHEGG